MEQTGTKEYLVKYKLAYTSIIVAIYLLGRNIPLYGVDVSTYTVTAGNAETLLMQAIGGDANRYSLFALGISPYMISSILTQIMVACRRAATRIQMLPSRISRIQLTLTMCFTLVQAIIRVRELNFRINASTEPLIKIIVIVEMITGVIMILWLGSRNEKYGIGGRTILIYINIIDGTMSILIGHSARELFIPLVLSAMLIIVTLVMEGGEKRIPMQRISIHNIYADKNYLAIKLNPVGIMPVMFASAFFTLPQLAVSGLCWLFPDNGTLLWWQENLALTRPLGIGVYIAILYLLTIGFAMITISPGDLAEQMMKGGDSILNLHAGRDTKRYLIREVCTSGFFSATVMSICLGIPMLLQLKGGINRELVMFPASIMMLTSLWYNLYQEFETIRSYEAYRPFI